LTVSVIIFDVETVAEQKQALLVAIFLFFNIFIALNFFTAPCHTAVLVSLEKRVKLFVVVCYFVPDVSVKVKLVEFKSLQVKMVQY